MRTSATAILALTASFGNAKDKELISHRTSQQNQHENIKEQLLSFLSGEKSNQQHSPKQGNAKNFSRNSIENLSVVGTIEKEDLKEDDANDFSTNIVSDNHQKKLLPPAKQRYLKFSSDGVLVNNDKNKVDDLRAQVSHKDVISNHDTFEGDQPEADVGILRLLTDRAAGAGSVPRLLSEEAAACGDISCNEGAFDTPCSNQGKSVTVSSGSCNGDKACNGIRKAATISCSSCNSGYQACAYMGQYGKGDNSFDITNHSCNAEKACAKLGGSGETDTRTYIEDNSCNSEKACYMMGRWAKNDCSIFIEEGSCIDYEACREVGFFCDNGSIGIYNYSCIGRRACFESFGNINADKYYSNYAVISDGSCIGHESCFRVGYSLYVGEFIVDGSSCVGEKSCKKFGYRAAYESSITNGSCHGKKACENVGRESWGSKFTIRDGACKGDYSCYAMGYNGAEGAYFHIDSGACNGYGACFQLARYSKSFRVLVGEGSCNGKFACATAWIKDEGSGIIIGKNACTCDHCCAFLKPGSRIGNGECTSFSDNCAGQDAPVIKGSL